MVMLFRVRVFRRNNAKKLNIAKPLVFIKIMET